MELIHKTFYVLSISVLLLCFCESAKITPRVLLPWFENVVVNFTFEISEGGCYTWSLSRDDIIDLEPLYENSWGHCSHTARVSVSRSCVPPGSVIILAEDVNTGEIIRGDVDVSKITTLKVISTTWKLYLEEAPEAFEVIAYDDEGNTFSSLEGISFAWTIENVENTVDEDPLVKLVRWRDTDYEPPQGVVELENENRQSYSVLLYGQALGEARVTCCLDSICTNFNLHVVASVVLLPVTAVIAPGDTLRYRVVRAKAGRFTVQDVADTLYYMKLPSDNIAVLEDTVSLVRAKAIGSTSIALKSGVTEVATAILYVAEPHSIRVTLRPSNLLVHGEIFIIHCLVLDIDERPLTSGDEILIRLSVDGDAHVDLLKSTENGTITDAIAHTAGQLTVSARLYSIGGRTLSRKVEGQTSATVIEPLEVVPPELYISWTDSIQEINLMHRGGGEEPVVWSEIENLYAKQKHLSLVPSGTLTIRGVGDIDVRVQLKKYPHVNAIGKVISAHPEYLQISSSGQARVGRPHHLFITLTATHPITGELFNFHRCNCASFAVSLLDGPEAHNITAATWVTPIEGACCALEAVWRARGVAALAVSGARAGADEARVVVRAAPRLLWPPRARAAALAHASLPVIAVGEALLPHSNDERVAELAYRDGSPPQRHPDSQLFTLKCRKKGDTALRLSSESADEDESVEFEVACATHVSRIRLEPPESPGNCSGGPKLWLLPGQDAKVKVTLLDAIGRELLDERGPKVKWDLAPHNKGIEYRALDRLFIETHPDFAPVPVPFKYYQVIVTDEKAIGWTGTLTANIPEATASIQARVVAPLKCDTTQVNLAWEGETVTNIVEVTGGSGRYTVEGPKGVTGVVENGQLSVVVPGPGTYDLVVADLCIANEKQYIEVHLEEVASVEAACARAVCVEACVPLAVRARGAAGRALRGGRAAEWRAAGAVEVRGGRLCGAREGAGAVRAALGGVWSAEREVTVFPPLRAAPERARLPAGARLQLRHAGGPPPHLASLHYEIVDGPNNIEISPTGMVLGVSLGHSRVRLVAKDINNEEMTSAESYVEVVAVSGLRVRAATHTLLVGAPGPVWLEAEGLGPSVLAALQPPPRVAWALREPHSARLLNTHADDLLERSTVEGLSIRVIPLKAGIITVDVKVRNMGKLIAESRTWESTIEIVALSDIRASVEGNPRELGAGGRLALAPGAHVRLRSLPRGNWRAHADAAVLELTPSGELRALAAGHGVVVAQHVDERNHIYRETALHVEVSVPHYCTAEPSGEEDESAVRVAMRSAVGRELLAPDAAVAAYPPLAMHVRRNIHSSLGNEIVITSLDAVGMFMTFESTAGGVTLKDEIWVVGSDVQSDRVVMAGGWGVCVEGGGWRAPPAVALREGAGATLALLTKDGTAKHALRADRPPRSFTIHQLPVAKIEFLPGEFPFGMVPLSIEATGLSSGPLLCTEEQRLALEGIQIDLPFSCRTQAPHLAQAILDLSTGQMGCSITPANVITEASEVELCAEWGVSRACTRVQLLPLIRIEPEAISLLKQPATFTLTGHPHALKLVKFSNSPGLKLEFDHKIDGEIGVTVTSDVSSCGTGWVNVRSRLTSQEMRVEVQKECDVACGSFLGAVFSVLTPYLPTLATIAAVGWASIYVYSKLMQKSVIRPPMPPTQTIPPTGMSPSPLDRSRSWSRSQYGLNGSATPIYGDASILPDNSYSPNSTRTHSRFL